MTEVGGWPKESGVEKKSSRKAEKVVNTRKETISTIIEENVSYTRLLRDLIMPLVCSY